MYLIRQHVFDIQCTSQTFGQEVQSQLGHLLEKFFYPKLEVLLNQYDVTDQYWVIEALDVEISNLSKKYWKEELIEKMLAQIEYYLKLNEHNAPNKTDLNLKKGTTSSSLQFQYKKWLLFYLKNGFIPQNSITNRIEEFVEKIVAEEIKAEELLQLFLEDEKALNRWIFSIKNRRFKEYYQLSKNEPLAIEIKEKWIPIWENSLKQFPNDFKMYLAVLSNDEFKKQLEELLFWKINLFQIKPSSETIKNLNTALEKFFNIPLKEMQHSFKILNSLSDGSFFNKKTFSYPMKQFIESWETSIGNQENKIDKVESVDFKVVDEVRKKETQFNDNVEYYINNAGLVLLHPFLERLFGLLGWTKDGEWTDYISLQKGVLSLHYLVFGDQEVDENQLVLNKILCGVAIDEVINTQIELSVLETEKCIDLLHAVLEHWHIIKDSSKEALQETFLQRDGKLEIQNIGFELWIKDHGADILLEQLPWGIGMIKTPWMEGYLNCYWNQ